MEGDAQTVYAVAETGGKQYRFHPGKVVQVERIDGAVGDGVILERVLLVAHDDGQVEVGRPTVSGAAVRCEIVAQGRDRKVTVFKYKPKANYRRKQGHRQPFTRLQVVAIERV